jgi:hypothetical protein
MAVACAAVLAINEVDAFQPYFGPLNPPLLVLACALVGAIALQALRRQGFEIVSPDTAKGILVSAALATCFAAAAILVDLALHYPRDMNVAAPWSLLFYPAIAFVAEIVFHIVPLAALLTLGGAIIAKPASERLAWLSIVVVALLEPTFQLYALSDDALAPADLYTGPHVFLFGLAQLWVFRRYGFVAMLTFRLVYYAYWHIAWGHARLSLLF